MSQHQNIEIHETAFVTATFRSLHEELSLDHFAHLWQNERTDIWIKRYLAEVSSEEPLTHSLRNRFFLDAIRDWAKSNPSGVVINFGCGFSMYPYLLDDGLTHIEFDKPEIINHKQKKTQNWTQDGLLPKSDIHRIGVDFSEVYQVQLREQINTLKKDRPSFIILEGVLFFLSLRQTNDLFEFFNEIQTIDDHIASGSFRDGLTKFPVYEKLMAFFNSQVSNEENHAHQTIEDSYYENIINYKLIDHQDYFSLSQAHGNKITSEREWILNEHFYHLKKCK